MTPARINRRVPVPPPLPEIMDVFPSVVVAPERVERLPGRPDLHGVLDDAASNLVAFVIFLRANFIRYLRVEWSERYQRHFSDMVGRIEPLESYLERSWAWSARKLKARVADNGQGYVDVRTCFMWLDHNFLVKCRFTFGLRTVEPGTAHLYQIGDVDMKFYFVDERYEHDRLSVGEGLFPVHEQDSYTKRTLFSNTCYLVPENTRYVVYATNRSFFSVHVVAADAVLPFPCTNPVTRVMRRPDPDAEDAVDFPLPRRQPSPPEAAVGDVNFSLPRRQPSPPEAAVTRMEDPCTSSTGPDEEDPEPEPVYIREMTVDCAMKCVSPEFRRWYEANFKNCLRRKVFVESVASNFPAADVTASTSEEEEDVVELD